MENGELTPEQKLHVNHAAGQALIPLLIDDPEVSALAAIKPDAVSRIFLAGVGAGADALARIIESER